MHIEERDVNIDNIETLKNWNERYIISFFVF